MTAPRSSALIFGRSRPRSHGGTRLRTARVRSLGLGRRRELVLGALLVLQGEDPQRAAERRGWTAQEVAKVSEGAFTMRSAASVLAHLEKEGLVKSVQGAAMPRVQWFATLP